MVSGFDARTGGRRDDAVYQQYLYRGDSGRGDSGRTVAKLWARQRLLDNCRYLAGDAIYDQPGERYLIVVTAPAGYRGSVPAGYFNTILFISPIIKI